MVAAEELDRPPRFAFFSGTTGLDQLRTDWCDLQARLDDVSYFQTFEWHRSIAGTLPAKNSTVVVVALYHGARLMAVLPLRACIVREFGMPVRTLTFDLHSHVQRNDFLVDPEVEANFDWDSLIACVEEEVGYRIDRLDLRDFAEKSCAQRMLSGRRSNGEVHERAREAALIDCSGAYQDNISHMPARVVRNIRRLERRAKKEEGVEYRSFRGTEITPDVIRAFLEIEHDSWKGRRGTSILSEPGLPAFYESIAADCGDAHRCQINILSYVGDEIAAQFGIVSNGAYHILKIGYREGYRDIGPGNLLLMYAIKHASTADDIDAINLTTAPNWSRKWASKTEQMFSHLDFRPTSVGAVLKVLKKARGAVRRSISRFE